MGEYRVRPVKRYDPRPFRGIWLPVVMTVLITGCAGVGPKDNKPSQEEAAGNAIIVRDEVAVDGDVQSDFEQATAFLAEEKYDEGIELLGKVIKRSPKSTAPYINLAMAYRKQGKLDKAEEQIKKALEISPLHPVANDEYAKIQRRKGNFTEARQLYEALLKTYPKFYPARKNLGILCDLYINDLPCALEQYEIYSKARPEDEKVTLWIADLRRRIE
jgi:tetratricopeptide (TPR) repeat protein